MGALGGADQVVFVNFAAQGDVFTQGFVKQRRVLRHDRKLVPQHREVEFAQLDPAQGDLAPVGIGHAGQQVEHRGLARAGRPDKRRGLPRLGHEAEAAQHLRLAIVQEHIVERDASIGRRFHPRAGLDRGLGVENLIDTLQTGGCDLPGPGQAAQTTQGLEGQRQRREEGHEIADRAFAPRDLGPAKGQHADETKAGHNVDQRRDHGAGGSDLDLGPADAVDDGGETVGLAVLDPVQAHGADAVQHLVDAGGAVGCVLPRGARLAPHIALHPDGGQDQQGRADQCGDGPFRVDADGDIEQCEQ